MALANDPVRISVTVVDNGGNKSTKIHPTNLTAAVDGLAAIEAARDALIAELDPVTDALIYRVTILLGQTDDTDVFGAGEVENVASITANLATMGKTAVVQIPAPADAIFVAASGPNYNVVDGSNADVLAYLALFETGGDFTLSDGEQLDVATPFNYGKRIHKASRKG